MLLDVAGAGFNYDVIDIGEKVYLSGIDSGISEDNWNVINRNKILLKAPITTPQGGGYKSLNVLSGKKVCAFTGILPKNSKMLRLNNNFMCFIMIIV